MMALHSLAYIVETRCMHNNIVFIFSKVSHRMQYHFKDDRRFIFRGASHESDFTLKNTHGYLFFGISSFDG